MGRKKATCTEDCTMGTSSGRFKVIPRFEGMDKVHYDRLIQAKDMIMGKMRFHAEDALDCSNADKRGVTTHMADISGDNSRHEMQLRLMTEDGNVIDLIEDAIERLINGEYGKCQDCGEMIPEARLEIRPYAIFCVKCKSRHEADGSF